MEKGFGSHATSSMDRSSGYPNQNLVKDRKGEVGTEGNNPFVFPETPGFLKGFERAIYWFSFGIWVTLRADEIFSRFSCKWSSLHPTGQQPERVDFFL